MGEDSRDTLITAVIRGDAPLASLQAAGVQVSRDSEGMTVSAIGGDAVVAEITDLVAGFLRYDGCSEQLSEWASVMLAGSAFLDLAALEDHGAGSTLIEALWDAADTGAIAPSARAVLRSFRALPHTKCD